jgi:hypothetical protein
MNVDKAKKRIEKQVKKGFNGYPEMSLEYFGKNDDLASEVVISFIAEEGAEAQTQKFASEHDARDDETIQSTLVKIIERANVSTVTQVENVTKLP